MKKFTTFITALFSIILINSTSFAEENKNFTKVAVINMTKVQKEAKVTRNLSDQQKDYLEEIKETVENKQKSFLEEKKEITNKKDVLSKEALMEKITEYHKKIQKFEQETAQKTQSVQKTFLETLQEVQKKYLDPILEDMAEKKGIDVLVSSDNAKIFNNDLDITEEVIDKLDDKVTKYKMDTPKGF